MYIGFLMLLLILESSINNKRGWDINPALFFISNNMGKGCLNKLDRSIKVDCKITPVGVKNIYLMHTSGITFTFDAGGTVTKATFANGFKSYLVEGYKQNIQVTTSVLSTDASQKLAVSVSFKMPSSSASLMKSVLLGSYYVLVESNSGVIYMVGVQAPLECSGFDFDSNGNAGLVTVTLSAPEGSAGNYLTGILSEVSKAIISKAA